MRRPIKAFAHFDYEASCLQIELANDCGITLTYQNEDDSDDPNPPSVSLWIGDSSYSFGHYSMSTGASG